MDIIKFGTDGWRAIIAKDFTVYNVARVSQGLAHWLRQSGNEAHVVIGHDCRFGGALFAATAAGVLCANGIKVSLAKGFVSTPMVSLGVKTLGAQQGVVITASHNPPDYNGYKLKGPHGGPTSPKDIAAVEALIPDAVTVPQTSLEEWEAKGMLQYVDLEQMYLDYLHTKFDLGKLDNAPYKLAYDAMYGAGQNVIRRTLPSAVLLHCDYNPSFKGTPPEPIHKNLGELSETMARTPELKVGLATDGDADRIGLYDEDGHFVDAHHIILLLIQYLHQYKGLGGKVVIAFSVTDRVKKMCAAYGLEVEVTPIGFKYISEKMIESDVLLGGEESGGIAIKGHIPERDGIFDGLIIYEYMMETGKTLKQLCEEVYAVTGRFAYERNDLHLTEEQKLRIMKEAGEGVYKAFGSYKVDRIETIDGIKYHLDNGGWIMLRASGTEPVLRIYAEGNSREEALDILEQVKQTVL
ncbi:phosphoglucomutase/phosphomannomutase family protein [Taibaiella koreensis]|uniref:phosphoglucomutase/phosphomannomutase family protein n=1 Tax=Taibaiella koreensis TaxID=1268548 RepID=UPI000E59C26E|nr:phosphoglucomutase/phosphomannomutase family protein [Taibaiella koreensis]